MVILISKVVYIGRLQDGPKSLISWNPCPSMFSFYTESWLACVIKNLWK